MGQFQFILWLAYWYLQEETFHFEWDHANSAKSRVKHGVDAEEVEALFTLRLGVPFGRQVSPETDEERLCIVGPSINDRMVSVVFTLREGKIRPIQCPASEPKRAEAL
jgi:uncharacterized DUF497 family protein